MFTKTNLKFIIFGLIMVFLYQNISAIPSKCALESSCSKNSTAADVVCILDEDHGCIRQYPNKCHLQIAACMSGKNWTDYSDIYCAMDTYLCENSYERWTIFFGNEE